MSDKDKADQVEAERPSNAVSLPGNSFYVHDLLPALDKAVKVKEEDRGAAIEQAIRDTAQLEGVLEGRSAPTVPEGHELREVKGEDGSVVTIPVFTDIQKGSGDPAEVKASATVVVAAGDEVKVGKVAA